MATRVKQPLVSLKPNDLLERARTHIFSTGIDDGAMRLALANMQYGLAKIHVAQEHLGFPPHAIFIGAPDCTVTRNRQRWNDGFGYGGKVVWGQGNDDLVILDVKPNACGMLVGGLEEIPPAKKVIERFVDLDRSSQSIDGIPLKWDFGVGNHFIDFFRVPHSTNSEFDLLPYAFIMHCSGGELRSDHNNTPGLYWDQSEILQNTMQQIPTPFGPVKVLTDSLAKGYAARCAYADKFTRKRREFAAKFLFDKFELITNVNHQKLENQNVMLLGTHNSQDPTTVKQVFPVCLRPDLPSYLFVGKPNFTPDVLESLGFTARATLIGMHDTLCKANILPHGSGYTFRELMAVEKVFTVDNRRFFVIDTANEMSKKIIENPRNLQFGYRGREVIIRLLELKLGELLVPLHPSYILKI